MKKGTHNHKADAVLDLWAQDFTSRQIADRLEIPSRATVDSFVATARMRGDARAVRRPQGPKLVHAPLVIERPSVPLLAPDLGIEAVTLLVRGTPSDSFSADHCIPVSVARVRCLEDVG